MKKIYRYKWRILGILVIGFLVWMFWPAQFTRTISYETTRITTPVDDQGFLDYETPLNEMVKGDIKPEENAMVLLVQAIGPKPEGTKMPPEYYSWLEIEEPKENGNILAQFSMPNLENPNQNLNSLPDECGQPWAAEVYPEVAEYLKANQAPLRIVEEGIRRPRYFGPLVARKVPGKRSLLFSTLLPFTQRLRSVAFILKVRAMNAIFESRFEDAWKDIYSIHRLGRLLQSNPSCLIEQLVGIAIEHIAFESYQILLTYTTWNSDEIRAKLQLFKQLPVAVSLAVPVDRFERMAALDSVQDFYLTGEFNSAMWRSHVLTMFHRILSRSIDFDVMLRRINTTYDRIIDAMQITNYASRQKILADISLELTFRQYDSVESFFFGKKKRAEIISDILLNLMLPACEKVDNACHRCRMQSGNIEIAFSLAEYRARAGNYPDKLEALKLPAAMLVDGYNGKQLHYERWREGYILCSLGVNEEFRRMLELELEEPNQNVLNTEMKTFRSTLIRLPWQAPRFE
ncbi:MAG: hypothetical protein R3B84_21395 [Zavarzinella sp.]